MHDPKYTEMPNATHAKMQTIAGSAILNMVYGMLQLTCIQFVIENAMQLEWCAEPGACKTDE